MTDIADILRDMAVTQHRTPKHVYPGYLALRIKQALLATKDAAPEEIIDTVGEIQTVGDCRYAIRVVDHNGTAYRITVAVDDTKQLEGAE